jgi:hypothetical protein
MTVRTDSNIFHYFYEIRHWQWYISSKSRASEIERLCAFCIYMKHVTGSGSFRKNNETRH